MKNLTKKTCTIISIVCFALAVLSVGISTIRIEQIKEANKENIDYGMDFIVKSHTNDLNAADMMEAALTLKDMEENNKKTDFYTWFRIIGGILFAAGGVYFVVSAKKKGEEHTNVADTNPTDNE